MIVRESCAAGREEERSVSPSEQRERTEAACERNGVQRVAVHQELDVSGGKHPHTDFAGDQSRPLRPTGEGARSSPGLR